MLQKAGAGQRRETHPLAEDRGHGGTALAGAGLEGSPGGGSARPGVGGEGADSLGLSSKALSVNGTQTKPSLHSGRGRGFPSLALKKIKET